jgi:hypothetical protein
VTTARVTPGFIQGHKYSGVGATMQWDQGPIDIALGESLKARIDQCVQIGASTAAANMEFADEPSSPGEFPRRVTGLLADNISSEVAGDGLNVAGRFGVLVDEAEGVDLIYALLLETGTSKMLARPWLSLTLSEIWDQWKAILGQSGTPYVNG